MIKIYHKCGSKNKHKNKIRYTSTKRALLQHLTMSICENDVEKECKIKGPEKTKRCEKTP